MSYVQFIDLPDEVIQQILYHLPFTDALATEATCRRLRNLANDPLIWKLHCQRSWTKWDPRHDIQTKFQDGSFTGWKRLFEGRIRAHSQALSGIAAMIETQVGRIQKVERIVNLGYDIKDTLLKSFHSAHVSENRLAQRYWSHVALGALHRSMGVNIWINIKAGMGNQNEELFEQSLGAFDLFVLGENRSGDVEEILAKLDSYVSAIRHDHSDIDEMSPRNKAHLVARYLLDRRWVGIETGRDYHNIEHNFLGVALFSSQHNSLPIITVVIYCCILRKLGLRAAPCSFPLHVHALVRPPPGFDLDGYPLQGEAEGGQCLYMDPFHSEDEVPMTLLNQHLQFMGYPMMPNDQPSFFAESNTREITVRCARNIHNSIHRSQQAPIEDVDRVAAAYAASWTMALFPGPFDSLRNCIIELVQLFADKFVYDIALIEKHIIPLTMNLGGYTRYQQVITALRRDDVEAIVPQFRTGINSVVKNKVGEVFQHRRYRYIAVITGWDHKCLSGEGWIQQMQVDLLPNGRAQPFYHVLVQDGSTRYVAEENIEIIRPENEIVDTFPIEIGKYFKRWDDTKKAFVSNIRDEYPDD